MEFKLPESKTTNLILLVFEMILIFLTFGINLGITPYDFQLIPLLVILMCMSIWNKHKLTKDNFYPIKISDDNQSFYLSTLMLITSLLLIVINTPIFPQVFSDTQIFFSSVIIAPIVEEIIFRHYMIGRLTDIYGDETKGVLISILISSLIFSLGHAYQGLFGVLASLLKGVLFACLYLIYKRNIIIPTFAHGLHNFIATIV